jgi:hypothetical protein
MQPPAVRASHLPAPAAMGVNDDGDPVAAPRSSARWVAPPQGVDRSARRSSDRAQRRRLMSRLRAHPAGTPAPRPARPAGVVTARRRRAAVAGAFGRRSRPPGAPASPALRARCSTGRSGDFTRRCTRLGAGERRLGAPRIVHAAPRSHPARQRSRPRRGGCRDAVHGLRSREGQGAADAGRGRHHDDRAGPSPPPISRRSAPRSSIASCRRSTSAASGCSANSRHSRRARRTRCCASSPRREPARSRAVRSLPSIGEAGRRPRLRSELTRAPCVGVTLEHDAVVQRVR